MCTEIRDSVPEIPGLKIKANVPITWVSIPEIQANVPRHEDQDVSYYSEMPEKQTMYMESGPKCLKSMLICTEIRASVPEHFGLKIKENMSVIWVSIPAVQANMPRNQHQGVCYHRQVKSSQVKSLFGITQK